jgi:hypothetical protein
LTSYILSLWRSEPPLARLLVTDMLAIGTIVNIVATMLAGLAFVAGLPVWAGVVLHLAPLPYNLLLLVSVWQKAQRSASPLAWGAQLVAALWFLAVLVV